MPLPPTSIGTISWLSISLSPFYLGIVNQSITCVNALRACRISIPASGNLIRQNLTAWTPQIYTKV